MNETHPIRVRFLLSCFDYYSQINPTICPQARGFQHLIVRLAFLLHHTNRMILLFYNLV